MSDRILLVQGDTGPQLKVDLTDKNTGDVVNLTGASAVMKFRAAGSDTTLFTRTGYIDPATAANGTVVFYWQSGDLNLDEGPYEGEIKVTFQGGMLQTVYDILKFNLRADFT